MTNEQQAISLQEKLEYFFVGLVFTILGLSVQTFDQQRQDPWQYFDILGWLLLFASGISGLARLESMFKHFKFHSRKEQIETVQASIEKRRTQEGLKELMLGISNAEDLNRLDIAAKDGIKTAEKWSKRNEATQAYSYWIAKWAFLGGLVAMFISRAASIIQK